MTSLSAGETAVLYVNDILESDISGTFNDNPLVFHPTDEGYFAFIGIDPLTENGYYPLELNGTSPFSQMVKVDSPGIVTGEVTIPEPLAHLLAPEVREEEDEILQTIYTIVNENKYWDGVFQPPVPTSLVSSNFGVLRSYNGGPFNVVHTGVDYGPPAGTPILVPANGVVAFSAPLDLRGNVVIIDHGMGIMTGYYHLSESKVSTGEPVTAGQELGIVGTTGLSTGIHLHWDMRVNGVPVNPTQWLTEQFP